MKKLQITQLRSKIGRPENQKRTLISLGLGKINRSVEIESTPQILGMVKKVNHLVRVKEL